MEQSAVEPAGGLGAVDRGGRIAVRIAAIRCRDAATRLHVPGQALERGKQPFAFRGEPQRADFRFRLFGQTLAQQQDLDKAVEQHGPILRHVTRVEVDAGEHVEQVRVAGKPQQAAWIAHGVLPGTVHRRGRTTVDIRIGAWHLGRRPEQGQAGAGGLPGEPCLPDVIATGEAPEQVLAARPPRRLARGRVTFGRLERVRQVAGDELEDARRIERANADGIEVERQGAAVVEFAAGDHGGKFAVLLQEGLDLRCLGRSVGSRHFVETVEQQQRTPGREQAGEMYAQLAQLPFQKGAQLFLARGPLAQADQQRNRRRRVGQRHFQRVVRELPQRRGLARARLAEQCRPAHLDESLRDVRVRA